MTDTKALAQAYADGMAAGLEVAVQRLETAFKLFGAYDPTFAKIIRGELTPEAIAAHLEAKRQGETPAPAGGAVH